MDASNHPINRRLAAGGQPPITLDEIAQMLSHHNLPAQPTSEDYHTFCARRDTHYPKPGVLRPDRPTGAKELDELLTAEQDQRYTDNERAVLIISGLNKECARAHQKRATSLEMIEEAAFEVEVQAAKRVKEIEMSDRQQKEKDDEILRLNKVIKEADDEEEETPLVILDMMDRTAKAEDANAALKVELQALKDYWAQKMADAKEVLVAQDEVCDYGGLPSVMEELGETLGIPELASWVDDAIEDAKDDALSDGIDQGREEMEDEWDNEEAELEAKVKAKEATIRSLTAGLGQEKEITKAYRDVMDELDEIVPELKEVDGGTIEGLVEWVKLSCEEQRKFEALERCLAANEKEAKKFEALEKFIENTTGWGDFVANISDYWKDQLVSAGYPAEDFGEFA